MKKIKYLVLIPALAAILFVFPAAKPAQAGGSFAIGFGFSVPYYGYYYDPYPAYYYPYGYGYHYPYSYGRGYGWWDDRPYWRGGRYYYPRHHRPYGRHHPRW